MSLVILMMGFAIGLLTLPCAVDIAEHTRSLFLPNQVQSLQQNNSELNFTAIQSLTIIVDSQYQSMNCVKKRMLHKWILNLFIQAINFSLVH